MAKPAPTVTGGQDIEAHVPQKELGPVFKAASGPARWADEQPPASHDPVFGLTSPEEQWALANLMRSIQDEGDPITRQAPPVEPDTCTHGIPFAQDCAACDEFAR